MNRPTLHTMVKDAPNGCLAEVRHLLIHPVDRPSVMILTKLISGIQTEIDTGTHYETSQKADELMLDWMAEGFRQKDAMERASEDLKLTIKLAMQMGYTIVYDPDQRTDKNLIGEVPLARWPRRSGKGGGTYEYAFTGTTIVASPALPPGCELSLGLSNKAFVEHLRQVETIRKSIGSSVELVLG